MSLSIVIIARDEERMIERAIASAMFADEVLVIDGGSTDATVEIAERAGVRVVERPFGDFARQRNRGLDEATGEWVLFLDADERIPRALAEEVRAVIAAPSHDVYRIPRRSMALGRWLDWHPGGPDAPARLMRAGTATWVGQVHETLAGGGEPGMLTEYMVHLTHRSITEVVAKINAYTDFEVAQRTEAGAAAPSARDVLAAFPRALKGLWRSGLKREGMEGAVEAFLLAFNQALVTAKLWERSRMDAIVAAYEQAEAELDVAEPIERVNGETGG